MSEGKVGNEIESKVLGVNMSKYRGGNQCQLGIQLDRKIDCGGEACDILEFLLTEEQVFSVALQIAGIYSNAQLHALGKNKALVEAIQRERHG